jgi:hypothetical protein
MTDRRCQAANPATCWKHGEFVLPSSPQNVESHMRESEKLKMILSPQESEALSDYLNQGYSDINAYLHGADVDTSPETLERIKHLDNALKKYEQLASAEPVVTYRATKCYRKFRNRKEVTAWVKNQFPKESKVRLAGFTSTTLNPESLFDFLPESHADMTPMVGGPFFKTQKDWDDFLSEQEDRGLGNLIFVMETRSGAPVSSYGQMYGSKELEYLHARDKEYVVKDVLPYRKVLNPNKADRRSTAHATIITLVEQ